MAFSQKYESTAAPRSTWNSVNSLLGVIFVSYKDSASAACVPSWEFIQLAGQDTFSRMPDHRLDYTIRRTLDRSLQQRDTEKALQRHAKDGTQCLQHWPQTLDCSKVADRIAWLCSVHQGTISFDANWRATLEEKRLNRQSCSHHWSGIPLLSLNCCGIGLVSHQFARFKFI